MRHSTIVYIVAGVLGFGSVSIPCAAGPMRMEIRAKALEQSNRLPRPISERNSVGVKINQTSLDDLEEPRGAKQSIKEPSVTSEQRDEARKLQEEPRDKKEKKRDEDKISKLFQRITGTLHVSFVFQTVPTDQPSTIQVHFMGRCVLPIGKSGRKTFTESMKSRAGVSGGKQAAAVAVRHLRTGIWEVSATAVDVASADPKVCAVPGDASLHGVTRPWVPEWMSNILE